MRAPEKRRENVRAFDSVLSTPSHLDICHQSLLSAEVIPSGCFAGTINDDKIRKSAQVRDKYLSVRFNEKKFKRHVANQATDFTRLLFTNIQMADKKEFWNFYLYTEKEKNWLNIVKYF